LPGAKVSGLYAGEAGVGAALLHAGCALNDEEFVAAAVSCARRLRDHPFGCPDLFNGTAGRLRFLLMLHEREQKASVLADALECAEELHRTAIRLNDGTAHWATVQPSGDLLEVASYAHGTSGVADVLLDLFEATGDAAHLDLALAGAQWVLERSMTTLVGGAGLDWGNGGAFNGLWCYGASGVGLLFAHLARLGVEKGAEQVAVGAASTAAAASRAAAPGLCHGLCGPIDYLLDMHRLTSNQIWLDEAKELAELLEAFHVDAPPGYPSYVEDESDISYMLGDAGVAVTLLRLADEGVTPRPLTVSAIRRLNAMAQGG
jgi:lantibiotic modifying enzyme